MNKITPIYIVFWLGYLVSLAQTPNVPLNTFCEDGGFESGVINMNDFRYGFGNNFIPNHTSSFTVSKLTLNPLPSILPNTLNGWTNSNYAAKFFEGITSPTPANALIEFPTFNLTCCGQSPVPQEQTHHQIQTVGPDLLIDTLLQRVHSGNFSMRLGNAAIDKGAEMMQKTFDVTPSTAQFSFWYAAVMGDPCEAGEQVTIYNQNTGFFEEVNCPSTHNSTSKTNFIVKIYNHTDNTFHDNLVNLGAGQNFIDNNSPLMSDVWNYRHNNILQMHQNGMKYTPWSFVSIPLHTLIGKRISVYFITTDCNASGHFSYVYLDDFCSEPTSDNPTGFIQLQDNPSGCGIGQICVDYNLPTKGDGSAGEVNLSLNIYQNGQQVQTLSSGLLTSGNNYCFSIDNNLLNSLSGSYFDYVVQGDFSINSASLPSQTIGIPGFGQNQTQNDDYQISCQNNPNLCCQIDELQVSLKRPRFGSDQINLTVGGISTPIQEIEVSVVDYHFSYDDPACKPADLGVFGNLSSNQINLNGLTLSGSGTQVISWIAGSPSIFNGQIPIKISKPNILKLSCCTGTFNVCLKIKVIDVNCNICEKLVCIDLPLEEQKIIRELPSDLQGSTGGTGPVLNDNEVINPATGKIWLNKNLGATRVAQSKDDALAFGDLYQWGRASDGHEARNSNTSQIISQNLMPNHSNFIITNFQNWTTSTQSPWNGINGINNPCPSGYRLPTEAEMYAEMMTWQPNNADGAFASPLKWVVAGVRNGNDGKLDEVGQRGYYWTSNPATNGGARNLRIFPFSANIYGGHMGNLSKGEKAFGNSVRCIKNIEYPFSYLIDGNCSHYYSIK